MITNFTDLQATLADWLHRTDLANSIPTFIQLAEARIYQGSKDAQMPTEPLRVSAMETQVSGSTSSGIGAITDMVQIRSVVIGSDTEAAPLTYASPADMTVLQRSLGKPIAYSVVAGSIVVGPQPDQDYPYSITYYKKFPALSATNPTNWLITNAPNLYLYGALIESAPYLHNDPRMLTWYRMFAAALNSVQAADDAMRTGGPLRMRAR